MVVDENGFTRLAALSEVAPGEMVQVVFEEDQTEVAVANVDGKIYAFRDVCPHMLFPLSVGRIEGEILECAGHGWRFSLKSGKTLYPPVRKGLILYDVQVRDDEIWAKVTSIY